MAKRKPDSSYQGKKGVDKLRASLAGHAYHEAWAARSALELLLPNTTLTAIVVEGLSPTDRSTSNTAADEIADLVRYHGARSVAAASKVEVVQFKYSIADAATPVRAANIAKTLTKFAAADSGFRAAHDDEHVERVLRYDYATNRPIHPNLDLAIASLLDATPAEGAVATQASQIEAAIRAGKCHPAQFLKRLVLSGNRGSLQQADRALQTQVADWSEAGDPDARGRLLQLRSLLRSKVNPDRPDDNLIDRVAVLAELGVDHESQLYPTPDAFPPVASVIGRPTASEIFSKSRTEQLPVVVHGAGGMGKTVLMQAVAEMLQATDHVVIFDGFGAGKWRVPEDGRHRPERTLVHLANLLAGQGLCDILLPMSDATSLMRAFRRRLAQAANAARNASADAGITLVLDAIDHAALEAKATGTTSFAHLLLKSLAIEPIDGVKVIASCRTERLKLAVGGASHRPVRVPAFTTDETRKLVVARDPSAITVEIAALHGRSGGNPRCLDALLVEGRPYDGPKPGGQNAKADDVLDALIKARIDAARETAFTRGAQPEEIDLLLSGLALLPPPVPIAELAASYGLEESVTESFVADLSPLLERTPHGIMFRDEPTETLIRKLSEADATARGRIVTQLLDRQSHSDYAARALPSVLTALKRTDELVALAYDTRLPPNASKVSQRNIRLARLVAAISACSADERFDDLFGLLLEASIVAAGHERSDRFLYEYPDLATVSGDAEALRRLFSTKVGWPGGRHSALSIANAFAGQMDEAQRESERTLDWLQWRQTQHREPQWGNDRISSRWDEVGFAYVRMIEGEEDRVVRWIASRSESDAYSKFDALFDLLERHAIHTKDMIAAAQRLEAKSASYRVSNRVYWAAALKFFASDDKRARQMVSQLATSSIPENERESPRSAILAGAMRAVRLGMRKEARTILGHASVRSHFYDFDSNHPVEQRAEVSVVAAGISAALGGRAATMLDIAPTEFINLVPPSWRKRGPRAFKRELDKRLLGPKPGSRPAKKRKVPVPQRRHDENYVRGAQHRIEPLIPYATFVARMIRPAKNETPKAVLTEALDYLENNVSKASNYPYRDEKAYLAKTGFSSLFEAAITTDALTRKSASQAVTWLKQAPGFYIPHLIKIAEVLSRQEVLHDAALELATHIAALISGDTDTSSRVSSFGDLARAVWRVSSEEAAAYFRRALDLTDALGSDEFDRTNNLLAISGRYSGEPLQPEATHNLARILELNLYDESKFPWDEYGQSMAYTAGLPALAIASRLDDRDKVDLQRSLAPMLTALLDADKIPADLATCILGLEPQVETWTWRLDTFAKAALKTLPPPRREWLFQIILIELDRDDRLSPWRDTIHGLVELAQEHLPTSSPALLRLSTIAARVGGREDAGPRTQWEPDPTEYEGFDVTDSDEIDRAIESLDLNEVGQAAPLRVLRGLAARVRRPADRLSFVRAVAAANGADLSNKLMALEDDIEAWSTHSAALRDALPQIANQLATKHADELIGSAWESSYSWRRLIRSFAADPSVLTRHVIAGLGTTATDAGGDAWLGLANHIAPVTSAPAMRLGLERFLSLATEKIPADVGDGVWGPEFAVGHDAAEVVSGLIWKRLGDYRAPSRWRAAHAVRRLAAVDRFEVIDHLVKRFEQLDGGPFEDRDLPFYPLHARLWLLIALARIAKDYPSAMSAHADFLMKIATDETFPHVAMRGFAADALRSISTAVPATKAKTLRDKIAKVNVSPFVRQPGKSYGKPFNQKRPGNQPDPNDRFHLDYDFNKYQVNHVYSTFECTEWEVRDRLTIWVKRWDNKISSMYDCPRINDHRKGSWSSSPPEVDRHGGYLAWHALMLTAGELLSIYPISGRSWRDDPWGDYVRDVTLSRRDGLWTADLTDLFPLDLARSVPMPETDLKRIDPKDHVLLAPLFGIDQAGNVSSRITVSGDWNVAVHTDASIRTVIASRANAEAAILAALTDRKFSQWLPANPDDVEDDYGINDSSVLGWIEDREHDYATLDKHDPYASPTALNRPFPADWLVSTYSLSASDESRRLWLTASDDAFVAEAWGTRGGHDERSWEDDGVRINASWPFVRSLLQTRGQVIAGFIRLRIYYPDRKSDELGNTDNFAHRVSGFTLDHHGRAKFISRISPKTWKVVNSLYQNDRFDFTARFKAIRKSRKR